MFRIIFLIYLFNPYQALACSYDADWFEPSFDWEHLTREIPPTFHFSVESIHRGRGPIEQGNGISVSSSCDDIGSIKIKILSENELDPCEYGFYIYETTKNAPIGLIPRYPIQPSKRNNECFISLRWIDGASWVQDQIDLVLEFEAVNNYLFKGDRSPRLKVFHDGNQQSP